MSKRFFYELQAKPLCYPTFKFHFVAAHSAGEG